MSDCLEILCYVDHGDDQLLIDWVTETFPAGKMRQNQLYQLKCRFAVWKNEEFLDNPKSSDYMWASILHDRKLNIKLQKKYNVLKSKNETQNA